MISLKGRAVYWKPVGVVREDTVFEVFVRYKTNVNRKKFILRWITKVYLEVAERIWFLLRRCSFRSSPFLGRISCAKAKYTVFGELIQFLSYNSFSHEDVCLMFSIFVNWQKKFCSLYPNRAIKFLSEIHICLYKFVLSLTHLKDKNTSCCLLGTALWPCVDRGGERERIRERE